MAKVPTIYKKIDTLRARYYKQALDKEHLLKIIRESEVSEHVYDSNAIENSTLSLEETDKILHQIDCDRFISAQEMFEAKNLARIVAYIEKKAKEEELNFDVMLLLHKMLLSNIDDEIAGRFRKDHEFVRLGSHIAPNPQEIISRLQEMLIEYHSTPSLNIIKRITKFHLLFEYIHPFCDGNGRIGRIFINYLLIREGYVPIIIKFADRKEYYQAFRDFNWDQKTAIMEGIIGKALTSSYHKRLAYLEGGKIVPLSEYAKEKTIMQALNISTQKATYAQIAKRLPYQLLFQYNLESIRDHLQPEFFEKLSQEVNNPSQYLFLSSSQEGERKKVVILSAFGQGGCKKAIKISEDRALYFPANFHEVGPPMWERVVEEEVHVSKYVASLGLLTQNLEEVFIFLEEENPEGIKTYLAPTFEALKEREIFVVDGKNTSSGIWEGNLLYDQGKGGIQEPSEFFFTELVQDVAKLFYYQMQTEGDSLNAAITGNTSKGYQARYFGFDYASKGRVGQKNLV